MVSLWPFGRDANHAASFERELSRLSARINKAAAQNERLTQRRRRYKVLWTLYSTFAYILVAAILTLVTGYAKWGVIEYTAIAGSPAVILGIRAALDAYYGWRIAHSQNNLHSLHEERRQVIERLKHATKYDSTQQLLEKYGGAAAPNRPPSPGPDAQRPSTGGPASKPSTPQPSRTGFAPPPTANIPGRQSPPGPPPSRGQPGPAPQPPTSLASTSPTPSLSPEADAPGEEFAPNAFTRPPGLPQPPQYATQGPKWYDRILDVVLGDDETSAKNRVALICGQCRLVNGQAPAGARTLEDVGTWRCSQCHAMNGVEAEHKSILPRISQQQGAPAEAAAPQPVANALESEDSDPPTPAASTRSKARQRKKRA